MVTKGVEPLVCTDWIRHKFTKSRIPDKVSFYVTVFEKHVTVTESKLILLAAGRANKSGDEMLRQGTATLIWKAGTLRRWWTSVPKNHFIGVWMPVSFIEQMGRRWGSKVKRPFVLQNLFPRLAWGRDVLISSFLQPFTGGQGQNVCLWAEQRPFTLTGRGAGFLVAGHYLCLQL